MGTPAAAPALENASLARTYIDLFNKHDWSGLADLGAKNYEGRDVPTGEVFRGPEGLRSFNELWGTAFPDARIENVNIIPAGDYVVCELTGMGTNTGPIKTPKGEMPPTGRQVELPCCMVQRYENGKVVSEHLYYDATTLFRQLELV